MFEINRKDAGGRYIDAEGDHLVTVSKVEENLDAKGREVEEEEETEEEGALFAGRVGEAREVNGGLVGKGEDL